MIVCGVRPAVLCVLLPSLLAAVVSAEIIDHTAIDGVAALPQSTLDAIGQQRWFFTHASVGSNMLSGLNDLHAADPGRYQLVTASVSYLSGQQRAANPPDPTVGGRVYECPRGNPGWQSKFTIFENSVEISGWHAPAVDVAMDKLCYIDQDADAAVYVNLMAALEAQYPQTVFVYITMPLTTSSDYDNVLRNVYNAAVRQHCGANSRLLYDLADMEAHDPNGNPATFTYQGQTYQRLCSGYTSDGGHLNTPGRQRIALGWYATAAAIVGPDSPTGDLNCDGVIDFDDINPFVLALSDPVAYQAAYPNCDILNGDCDGDGDVDFDDINAFVALLGG